MRPAQAGTLGVAVVTAAFTVAGPARAHGPSTSKERAAQECSGDLAANASDFNGDGHADAAVADPFAGVDGLSDAGAVTIMYGESGGGTGEGPRARVTQNSPGVPGGAEEGDRFGFAVEAFNLDADGCTDLVVSAPGEDLGAADAGAVTVMFGSPGGLGSGRPTLWIDQDTANIPGGDERGDQFGYRLSTAPAMGPDAATIVAGSPYEDVGSVRDAGAATAMWFTGAGQVAAARWFDQDTPGVPGAPEAADLFGSDVELTQVSGSSGRWDLIAGLPYEDVGSASDAGAVTVIEDIAEARSSYPSQWWSQDTSGVAGGVEAGDLFGTDPEHVVTPEGTYVAVGVPGEALDGAANAGMAQVFRTSGGGLQPQRVFHQNTPGAEGAVEPSDYFGGVLHGVERPVAGGEARLVVGLPYEDLGNVQDAGAVQSFSLDASDVQDRWFEQGSSGVSDSPESRDEFGSALGTAGDQDEQVLLVGVPRENARGLVHVLPFGGAGDRTWTSGEAERFGFGLAGHR
ncbi:integrin alpha [Actinomadura sp. 3N407]|uniref:integrin alpha n=1 Tax=Actinomadura sp. 3N407 TaxID=3457423 RepID=UPI003FCC4B78